MSALTETLDGALAVGLLFGAAPWTAFQIARRDLDREAARALALAHTSSVRRRARIRLDCRGEPDRRPDGSAFVLVYNQTSMADDLGNLEVLWRFTDYSVLAAEYGYIPFFRAASDKIVIVLMQRGNRTATDRTLDRLVEAASAGAVVSVAAEGRLSPDGRVGHFKRGAFLVAIRAGVPIVPMAVQGGREILRPGSVRLRPGTLRYRFGAAIPVAGIAEDGAPALAEHTRQVVAGLVAEAAAQGSS
ncbi:MAG: lysophospholipid acyltransferase family protein [Gemmatimonadota bacterium]